MSSIKDTAILILFCAFWMWLGFHLGSYYTKAHLYEIQASDAQNEALRQQVDLYLGSIFPEAR